MDVSMYKYMNKYRDIHVYICINAIYTTRAATHRVVYRKGFGCAPLEASVRLKCGARCAN